MAEKRYDQAVAAFLDYLRHGRNRSPRTIEAYGLTLRRLAEYMREADPLDATHDDLVMFAGRWLFEKGVSANARRPYVACLRSFFKWAAGPGRLISKNPALSLESPKLSKRVPLRLTLENAEKLLNLPDLSTLKGLRDSAIMHVLLGCGVRVSALTGINEGDFTQDKIEGHRRLFVKVRTKGDQEEIKLLPQEADLIVRMYLEHPELAKINRDIKGDKVVFVQLGSTKLPPDQWIGEARRLSRKAVFQMIKAYGKKAEIPDNQLHPHAMRHAFGTELVESDVHLSRVQELMGHKDPKNTQIYVHLAMAKMSKELDRANPLAKISTPISQFLKRLKP